jgi:hypothetical protein
MRDIAETLLWNHYATQFVVIIVGGPYTIYVVIYFVGEY